jgi:class 3 adenylate cyclase
MTATRRLAAIVVADVVGYSRLMEAGEAGTLKTLVERHAAVSTGGVGHAFLTSLIDSHGVLRVQCFGFRVAAEEFRRDLESLHVEFHSL